MSQSPNQLQVPQEEVPDNVSVTSKPAYEDGQTYSQVSDLLKGVVKQDQLHIQINDQQSNQPIYEEPIHLKVNVPQMDYSSLNMRQEEFEKRKSDWLSKIAKQEAMMVRLKTLNVDLLGRLKQMNL